MQRFESVIANLGRYNRIETSFRGRIAMADDEVEIQQAFEQIRAFEWDEQKRANNLEVRKIDFQDVKEFSTATCSPVGQIAMAKSGTKSSDMSKATKSRSSARSATTSAGSSRRGGRGGMKGKNITVVSRDDRRKGKTDWAAVDALTDREINASIANDPDWSEDWHWSDAVLVIPPKKQAISIRVDDDVLGFFKREGPGYQRRINAVLRSYAQQKRKKRA
jgi:uncharacterized protein (DUF4415 family)